MSERKRVDGEKEGGMERKREREREREDVERRM